MHPHVSFEPIATHNKTYSYLHPSIHNEQSNLSSQYPHNHNMRNNYHYNYSPSNASQQKILQHSTAEQQFYRPQAKQEYQTRPQSSKDRQGHNNYAINSRPVFSTQNKRQALKFTREMFPSTFKLLDLSKFVEENVKLRKKLLQELQMIKEKKTNFRSKTILNQQQKGKSSTRDTTPKRISRQKASNLYGKQRKNLTQNISNLTPQNQSEEQEIKYLSEAKRQKQLQIHSQKQTLEQLQAANAQKRQQVLKLQSEALHQSIHETPLLRQKQQAIEYLSIEVEWLNQKCSELKKLVNSKSEQDNLFEMYEKMCREVESLRKENNKKSEKLKKLFEKTNQLTGKQENVNMFLMNLKV